MDKLKFSLFLFYWTYFIIYYSTFFHLTVGIHIALNFTQLCPGLHTAAKLRFSCACKKSQESQGLQFFSPMQYLRLFARLTKFKAQICYCYDHFVQVSKTAVKIIYIPTFTHLRLKTSEAVKIIH